MQQAIDYLASVSTRLDAHVLFSWITSARHDDPRRHLDTFVPCLGFILSFPFYNERYLAYDDTTSVKLANVDRNGDIVKAVTVQAGAYHQPQLVAAAGRFYVVTEDAGGRGYVTVFDGNLDKIEGSMIGGGLGRLMKYPTLAVDGSTWVIAYQDGQGGSVKLQRLVPLP